jgi:hypothetical protein
MNRAFWLACALLLAARPGMSAPQNAAPAPPDFSGSWEHHGGFVAGPRKGVVTPPADPKTVPPPPAPPPLKPEYLADWQVRVKAARDADANGQPLATNDTSCLPQGMPGMMMAIFPIEFLHSRGQVTIIEEAFTQVRRILLDQPQLAVDVVEPSFYGHSVGHWEGDTLVADTVGIKDNLRFLNVPHSKDLRIHERIHLVATDILWDEITLEDPAVLERPWSVTYAYRRMPGYTLLEYICEDNREYEDEHGRQQIRIGPRAK